MAVFSVALKRGEFLTAASEPAWGASGAYGKSYAKVNIGTGARK